MLWLMLNNPGAQGVAPEGTSTLGLTALVGRGELWRTDSWFLSTSSLTSIPNQKLKVDNRSSAVRGRYFRGRRLPVPGTELPPELAPVGGMPWSRGLETSQESSSSSTSSALLSGANELEVGTSRKRTAGAARTRMVSVPPATVNCDACPVINGGVAAAGLSPPRLPPPDHQDLAAPSPALGEVGGVLPGCPS